VFSNSSAGKPIKVFENNTHFLVEIPASQKERASRIAGRRWDTNLVAWIYPKTIECYEALYKEFAKNSDEFEIRKPKRKSAPQAVKASVDNEADHDFENEWKEMSEQTSSIHNSLPDVSGKIDVLLKTVKSLEESSNSVEQMIISQRLEAVLEEDAEANNNSDSVDGNTDQLECLLKSIAYESTGNDESFNQHIDKYQPIVKPERFVMRTHERLLNSLAEMSGDLNPRESSFAKYVHYVKDNELVPNTREKNVPAVLFMLNGHRNQIVHSREMSEFELKNRSISYLMGVAHIWREVASEPVGDE